MKGLRIVSLLPSATEMIACIMEAQPIGSHGPLHFVGRSHECDFPPSFVKDIPMLTTQKTHFNLSSANPAKEIDDQVRAALATSSSLYDIAVEDLVALNPDVILTQSLCEVCSIDLVSVERIVHKHLKQCKVLDLNPHTLQEILLDINRIGELMGCQEGSQRVVNTFQARVQRIAANPAKRRVPKVLFMEWTDPIYVGGHWTPEIIFQAGGLHLYNTPGAKSFRVADETVDSNAVDILLIAPCGMNLEQTRKLVENILDDTVRGPWFRALHAFKTNRVVLVDGNQMFNRPGPRLVDCLEWLDMIFENWCNNEENILANISTGFPAERL